MIFGASPTRSALVIARTTGSGGTFVITSIEAIPFQAGSGHDLTELLQRLLVIFSRGRPGRRSRVALLATSSGRFKSSVEAIKAEAIIELAAAESGLPVVKVTAASLEKVLGCTAGQKWHARAAERFNPTGRHRNWSHGAAGAAAAALKVAGETKRGPLNRGRAVGGLAPCVIDRRRAGRRGPRDPSDVPPPVCCAGTRRDR